MRRRAVIHPLHALAVRRGGILLRRDMAVEPKLPLLRRHGQGGLLLDAVEGVPGCRGRAEPGDGELLGALLPGRRTEGHERRRGAGFRRELPLRRRRVIWLRPALVLHRDAGLPRPANRAEEVPLHGSKTQELEPKKSLPRRLEIGRAHV